MEETKSEKDRAVPKCTYCGKDATTFNSKHNGKTLNIPLCDGCANFKVKENILKIVKNGKMSKM